MGFQGGGNREKLRKISHFLIFCIEMGKRGGIEPLRTGAGTGSKKIWEEERSFWEREFKKATTATTTGTSLNKRFNE